MKYEELARFRTNIIRTQAYLARCYTEVRAQSVKLDYEHVRFVVFAALTMNIYVWVTRYGFRVGSTQRRMWLVELDIGAK
jgi:hypothetical protein